MSRYGILLAILLTCFVCRADDFYGNRFVSQRVSTGAPPKIDGKIAPGEWDDAALLPPFRIVDTEMKLDDAPQKIMMKFDEKNLYIGFLCRMDFDLDLRPIARDKYDIFKVESFEFIFRPKHDEMKARSMRFGVERGGGKLDQRFFSWNDQDPKAWNPEWQYQTTVTSQDYFASGIWEGEIAIPWETLELDPPNETGTVTLPFNIIRYRGNTMTGNYSGSRISSFVPVPHEWEYKKHTQLGRLLLLKNKPVLRHISSSDYSNGEGSLQAALTRNTGYSAHYALWRLDGKAFFVNETQKKNGRSVGYRKKLDLKTQEDALGFWEISDASGVIAKQQIKTTVHPLFHADIEWISDQDKVVCVCNDVPKLASAAALSIRILDEKGNCLATRKQQFPPGKSWFEAELSAEKIADHTEFTVAVELKDRNRTYTFSRKLKKEFPPWHSFRRPEVKRPPFTWEPVSVSETGAGIELGILDHRFIFSRGVLPAVQLHGEPFSVGAWQFAVDSAEGREVFELEKPIAVSRRDGRGVTLDYEGRSERFRLRAEIRVEFDGLAWFDLSLTPRKRPASVNSIALVCPIAADKVRYMNAQVMNFALHTSSARALIGAAKTDRPIPLPNISAQPRISWNGWKFEEMFYNFYWIGGEDRGVYFVLPSRENLNIKGKYNETAEEDKKFVFSLHLIDQPTSVNEPLRYRFGLMLTPAKKIINPSALRKVGQYFPSPGWNKDFTRNRTVDPNCFNKVRYADHFMRREQMPQLAKGYYYTAMLPVWLLPKVQCGAALPPRKDVELIANHAKGILKSSGNHPCLWYDPMITCTEIPQIKPFLNDWEVYPKVRIPVEASSTVVCPASSYPQYYLYGMANYLKEGISCFYNDMTALNPCSNRLHGCGWRDRAGTVHPEIPFLAIREYFLEMQTLVKNNNPEGIIIFHGTSIIASWLDVQILGEEFTIADNYHDLSPEYYQLQKVNGRQLGVASMNFAGLLYAHYPKALKNVTQNECWGLSLLHNESIYNVHACEIPGNVMVFEVLDRFGADEPDCEFVPYWRNPLSLYPREPIAVSSYRRNGKELLVVFNLSDETQKWKLPESGKKYFASLTEESFAGEVEMAPRMFRFLQAE